MKPLGHKSYGSIPHVSFSQTRGDKVISQGQECIIFEKPRRGDRIIALEKMDGSNVAIANIGGEIVPLIRRGYRAIDSDHPGHHVFHDWAMEFEFVFKSALEPGQRICGEWMPMPSGTRYYEHTPNFFAFDIIEGQKRLPYRHLESMYANWIGRRVPGFMLPFKLWDNSSPIPKTFKEQMLCGTLEISPWTPKMEGMVFRVENHEKGIFLAKWVRPDYVAGKYFKEEVTK